MNKITAFLAGLITVSGTVYAQTFDDPTIFEGYFGAALTTEDFEGIASGPGQTGAVQLLGDEFPGLYFSAGDGIEEGMFVEIPDDRRRSLGVVPVSGEALFCPDSFSDSRGTVLVDFDPAVRGVGGFFMDMEAVGTYLEAFDGPGGTGTSLGKVDLPVLGNGVQAFAGIVADDIQSIVMQFGVTEGVCLDDLSWASSPALSCIGFEPPMANYPVTAKKNRALPLKTKVFNADGVALTDLDLVAPPVVQVLYDSGTGGDPVDVTYDVLAAGQGTEGNQFVFTDDLKWQFNLKTSNYSGSGTYTVIMESGDLSEYVIDPTCLTEFIVK